MPYGPHAADDRARMLETIGVASVDELFDDIPERAARGSAPPGRAGARAGALAPAWSRLAARNRVDLASFLGAGAYRHWTPAVVDQMLLRGEWYTAYTPYQPEVSQGTLQSIYEYQSMLAELTGLDVVSASHYDGGAATAEAALMTCRATRRRADPRVARRPSPLPADAADLRRRRGPRRGRDPARRGRAAGGHDGPRGARRASSPTPPGRSPVSSPRSPTSSACSRTCPEIGRLAHAAGALFVSVIEPVSLAVLAPPGEYGADIAAGEGQPLGIPLQYGGPYLGIVACTDPLVRQIPGRLVGQTTDLEGRRAFVMTMRAREQDIRREKAASNICTNQALLALAASIYLAAIGPHGLRDVAARRCRTGVGAGGGPGRRRRAPAPRRALPQRVRRPGAGCPRASTPRCWNGACWPASRPPTCSRTSRRWPTASWCVRPR